MSYYNTFRTLFRGFFRLFYRWEVIGSENIPASGPVILCSNHISNYDPLIVGCSSERRVHFMAKEELFRIPIVSFLIRQFGAFPVKRGAADRSAIRSTLQILEEGKVLGIFPEGTRSKTGDLKKGLPGVAMFALKSQAAVVPVAIVGPYRLFRPVKVVIGKPIDLTAYREQKASGEVLKETTDLIMRHIGDLLAQNR